MASDPSGMAAAFLLSCVALSAPPRAQATAPAGGAAAAAAAQARIGVFLWHDAPNDAATFAGVRDGFAAAHVACEFVVRDAGGDVGRAVADLAFLRASDCALVLAIGTQAALVAARTLRDRPVVFAAVDDPVAAGIVAGWGGSGRNIAGACYTIPPATAAHVFLLGVPGLERLGMLRSLASGVVSRAELQAMRRYLEQPDAPRLQVVEAVAADAADVPRAVEALRTAGVQAIWIPNDATIYGNLQRVRAALAGARLPLVATAPGAARSDAVVGATVDFGLHGRRAAALALHVLRGADPGSLPIDTMQSYLVIANLDAARRTGCELPLPLLALADELIAAQPAAGTALPHDDRR